ncbi:class 3-domain-containing protein [Sporodiniella umbellata]|nr:class 3-domain-containing protein [Sporodiniella umbellata]
MSDQWIRKLLSSFTPPHPTQRHLSVINVSHARFFSEGLEEEKAGDGKVPYSVSLAHQLCVASKLAYEDVDVVRYELEQGGYRMASFKPIGYKNTCAYVIENEQAIFLVFRGTNPLNMQNYVTNLDAGLTEITIGQTQAKVHQGFWDAMGATQHQDAPGPSELHLNLNYGSLRQTIVSAMLAIFHIVKLMSVHIFQNVTDPIDASWLASASIRHHSLYSQAEHTILQSAGGSQKRLYITGHSLGGALATVFLAKAIQSQSKLLSLFEGLYTFGQPNMGDPAFGQSFPVEISSKIFNHTYNNDVVPRIPFWYSPPPGHLVFIDAAYQILIYPPRNNQQPVPVRPISYLHPSGLLNTSVIRRLKQETSVRILFRLLFPFFINDHFPSDYSDALLSGRLQGVVLDETQGGDEKKRYPMPSA